MYGGTTYTFTGVTATATYGGVIHPSLPPSGNCIWPGRKIYDTSGSTLTQIVSPPKNFCCSTSSDSGIAYNENLKQCNAPFPGQGVSGIMSINTDGDKVTYSCRAPVRIDTYKIGSEIGLGRDTTIYTGKDPNNRVIYQCFYIQKITQGKPICTPGVGGWGCP